jgi:hypothetical protein
VAGSDAQNFRRRHIVNRSLSFPDAFRVNDLQAWKLTSSSPPNMANSASAPLHKQAYSLALDVANGRHPLSKFIAPALVAFDILLTALIIWKVPCPYQCARCSLHYLDLGC